MFRARAEKVSGKRVFAKGTWLTCIGNKSVSVGDLIYTDGRCVYGFYQEAQQPQVITPRKKNEIGIPILYFGESGWFTGRKVYYYTLNYPSLTLEENEAFEGNLISVAGDNRYLVNNSENVYVDKTYLGRLYNDEGNYKGSTSVIDTNIDDQNNFYVMLYVYFENKKKIQILKNGDIINSVDITNWGEEITPAVTSVGDEPFSINIWRETDEGDILERSTRSYGQREPMEGIPSANIITGFINNEEDWAFIVECTSDITVPGYHMDAEEKHHITVNNNTTWLSMTWITETFASAFVRANFLVTPQGKEKIYEFIEEEEDIIHLYAPDEIYISQNAQSYDTKSKIPLQDGYYFKIDEVVGDTGAEKMKLTFYNPDDESFLTETFDFDAKLALYKDKILSVKTSTTWQEGVVKRGLYAITGDTSQPLKKIIGDSIANHKLRPLKKPKNWNQNILHMYQTPTATTINYDNYDLKEDPTYKYDKYKEAD